MRIKLPVVVSAVAIAASLFPLRSLSSDSGGINPQTQKLLREAATVLLKEGNLRFAAGKPLHPSAEPERRTATALEGQAPLATVLSCADSRVPVELVFDRGLGEIFTVRVAGNVADTDEIATMEYGVGHLRTPLVVVMGHTHCGAVTAVVKGAEVHGLLPQLIDNIQPAVDRARTAGGDESALLANSIKENVWQAIADILKRSSVIRSEVQSGSVRMVGAIYELETGIVQWLGEHPNQKTMINAWSGLPV
ncbi:MAG: carbonic anhydrase, partial [Verrucomicrobiales bacterium]|nr:carbonic anhydrase [Verrucomicrobiales bacterium]